MRSAIGIQATILAVTMAAGLTACKSGEEAPAEAPAAQAEAGPPDILTEEGFKALHPEKPDGEWPQFKGERVGLGAIGAYLSLPEGVPPPLPTVILVHEWWGLNEHMKLWADRLAADGYAALAIDIFGGVSTRDHNEAMGLYQSALRDTESAREMFSRAQDFVENDERIQARRIASMGFGQGGMWAFRGGLLLRNPAAVVDYYGLPLLPPDEMKALTVPVLAFYAKKDVSTPPAAVDFVEKTLKEGGVPHEIVRYNSADHAFANPQTGRYDAVTAADAWKLTRQFLDVNVKQPTDRVRAELQAAAEAEGGDGGTAAEPTAPAGAAPAAAKTGAK